MSKKIGIIGAGPGGLTAGMLLAHKGYEVHIYEKKDTIGGRNARIELEGYTFDTGPTFLMLSKILHEVFQYSGRKIEDYLELIELDPLYRLDFGEKTLLPTRDRDAMRSQLKALFPGDEQAYDLFMDQEAEKFRRVYKCLKFPYHRLIHYVRPKFLHAIPKLDLTKTIYQRLSDYFTYEEMRLSMTFQSKYLGMSPWECPAAFTILSFIEHGHGIYHPIGGLNEISNAMAKVIKEDGGHIHLNTAVKQISVDRGKATGVLLENGEKISLDQVILNGDFAKSMEDIVPEKNRKKYSNAKLQKKKYSCSTFMLYLGVDKRYDFQHHNVFFADDYEKNLREISETKILSEDPSFYIQNASITDDTLAPEGKSTIYVLVPVPNNMSEIDWDKEKVPFRNKVISKIMDRTQMKDLDQHIEVEKIITPYDWERDYDVYLGATFNLAHSLDQMLYLRPHNKFECLENMFIVGGGTHPGSGLPTIYESGRIAANMIILGKKLGSGYIYKDQFDDE